MYNMYIVYVFSYLSTIPGGFGERGLRERLGKASCLPSRGSQVGLGEHRPQDASSMPEAAEQTQETWFRV